MNKKWNENEIKLLKEFYPILGKKICAEKIGRSENAVSCKAEELKIKVKIKVRTQKMMDGKSKKKNERIKKEIELQDSYLNINTAEIAYTLGFLWGDGGLDYDGVRTYPNLEINQSDFKYIEKTINCLVISDKEWKYYFRKRSETWKPSVKAALHDRYLGAYLKYHDYEIKSGASADKILSKIPKELIKYFFRGYFDADGNYNYNLKGSSHTFSVSSCYDQNWLFVEKYFLSLGIETFFIYRRVNKKGQKHSEIVINRIRLLKKLFEDIYIDYPNDKIGFERKYIEFKKIYDSPSFGTSDYPGVTKCKNKGWRVEVKRAKNETKRKFMGYFKTEEEAIFVAKLCKNKTPQELDELKIKMDSEYPYCDDQKTHPVSVS